MISSSGSTIPSRRFRHLRLRSRYLRSRSRSRPNLRKRRRLTRVRNLRSRRSCRRRLLRRLQRRWVWAALTVSTRRRTLTVDPDESV